MTKTIKFKEDKPDIIDWVKCQSDFSKSIRKLIHKELMENGMKDILLE